MKKNLVLLGMMAVGKTTLGRMVAKNHNLEFIDTDTIIKNKYLMNINDIFKKKGEKFFRNEEKKEVLKQLKKNNCINLFKRNKLIIANFMLYKFTRHRYFYFIKQKYC